MFCCTFVPHTFWWDQIFLTRHVLSHRNIGQVKMLHFRTPLNSFKSNLFSSGKSNQKCCFGPPSLGVPQSESRHHRRCPCVLRALSWQVFSRASTYRVFECIDARVCTVRAGLWAPGLFSRSEPEPEIFRAMGFSGFLGQKNGVDVSYQFCHL